MTALVFRKTAVGSSVLNFRAIWIGLKLVPVLAVSCTTWTLPRDSRALEYLRVTFGPDSGILEKWGHNGELVQGLCIPDTSVSCCVLA